MDAIGADERFAASVVPDQEGSDKKSSRFGGLSKVAPDGEQMAVASQDDTTEARSGGTREGQVSFWDVGTADSRASLDGKALTLTPSPEHPDEQEIVWVLYREWYDEVRDMFILVLDDEDLIIVRIEGYLNRLLQKIVEDETYATRLLD